MIAQKIQASKQAKQASKRTKQASKQSKQASQEHPNTVDRVELAEPILENKKKIGINALMALTTLCRFERIEGVNNT